MLLTSAAYVILSFTVLTRSFISSALLKELKYPGNLLTRPMFAIRNNADITFKDRLRPIEIRSVVEILSVEIQALSELQQLSELLDQGHTSKSRLAGSHQSIWKSSHTRKIFLQGHL